MYVQIGAQIDPQVPLLLLRKVHIKVNFKPGGGGQVEAVGIKLIIGRFGTKC